MKLLLVEDDAMAAGGMRMCLQQADMDVTWADTAERAMQEVERTQFGLAVIDLGLPGLDGIALISRLRAQGHAWPILILTARDALEDRVRGLDAGADDYMIKPFEAPELQARLRALLRRFQADTSRVLQFAGVNMDLVHRRVHASAADGAAQELMLSPKEWLTLEYMLQQQPKAVSKDRLLERLGRVGGDLTPNAVEVYVSRLRSKLGPVGVYITHIRGYGYRLVDLTVPT